MERGKFKILNTPTSSRGGSPIPDELFQSATHELGHIPGEEGEMEALATLKLIRACMISECAALCSTAGAGAGSGLLPPLGSMRNARSGGGGGPKMARGSGRAIRAAGLMKPTGIAAMA